MKIHSVAAGAILALALTAPAAAGFSRDGASIQNSGSTNTAGFTIELWSTGQTNAPKAVPDSLARRFFSDVKAARDGRATGGHCMKSASFGYRLNVRWHGWLSPDLTCPGGSALTQALANDVAEVLQASGAESSGRRRLPIEPRMRVNEPSPVPTGAPR